MEENEHGTDSTAAADSAASAAITSANAERAAADAASAAASAASAAETAAESVSATAEAIAEHGTEVIASAETAAQIGVDAAVVQIEKDLQEENTWLQEQFLIQNRDRATAKESIVQTLTEMLNGFFQRMESLLSNHRPSGSSQTPASQDEPSGDGRRVPEPPAQSTPKKKHRMI